MKVNNKTCQPRVVTSIERTSRTAIESISRCYTGFILDRIGKVGVMNGIHPLSPGMRICGPAITSFGPDLSVRRMAINLAEPGDILVVAAGGYTDRACFGDGTARRMMLKQMRGAVIDGSTRDAQFLRSLSFPTFVKGITPLNYDYPIVSIGGGVNVTVSCGGVLVSPGDLILGDDDGVIVVPRRTAEQLARALEEELSKEQMDRARMKTFEPFNVEEELRARGYTFE
jgi:4-hydroxy-4-methyl-2-oxoglutarate aldolase